MNKIGFIKELSKETGYSEQKCILINNVIENYFIFGRRNKDKIIKDLQTKITLTEDDAENIYDISMKIITGEIKNKLKHPFKSKLSIQITSYLYMRKVCLNYKHNL